MSKMATKEPGYVYILTNPSFREDWVKIGKSSRPVLPLCDNNREFFNVKPEALEIFRDVAMLLDDAEIKVYHKRKSIIPLPQDETPQQNSRNKDFAIEDMAGRISIIINGKVSYKSRLGYDVVNEYLSAHPQTTMQTLKEIFNDRMLGEWSQWKMLEEDIEHAKKLKEITGYPRHQIKRHFILKSGDGVRFVVSNQWSIVNVMNLIRFIQKQGWSLKIKKEEK